jgi:vacuolar-type H+-ATPase subunit H
LKANAEVEAKEIITRANRREAEAQASTQVLREQAANDLATAQRQSHELIRKARAEAQGLEAQAREHSDELRGPARKLLADAEARVAALNQRRDEITKELTQLSGVIEALAIPGFHAGGGMSGSEGSTGESG